MAQTQASHMARLNDLCRTAPGLGGQWVITQGIGALPVSVQSQIRERVETYADWSSANDPYGEHDFGAFMIEGYRLFFKIDYYDLSLEFHSPDPADPTVTRRVLCVMLSEEY